MKKFIILFLGIHLILGSGCMTLRQSPYLYPVGTQVPMAGEVPRVQATGIPQPKWVRASSQVRCQRATLWVGAPFLGGKQHAWITQGATVIFIRNYKRNADNYQTGCISPLGVGFIPAPEDVGDCETYYFGFRQCGN